jgi:DNA-binding transcriptional ArsR family regulator
VWADGAHSQVRLGQARSAVLVPMGVRTDGSQGLIAPAEGLREPAEPWAGLPPGSRAPSPRSRYHRSAGAGRVSTTVGRGPFRESQYASAGPAIPAPTISTSGFFMTMTSRSVDDQVPGECRPGLRERQHRAVRSVMTELTADRSDSERGCNSFNLPISKQTQTHHFRVLREAGLIDEVDYGNRKGIRLRRAEIDKRFPGLLTLLGAEPPGDIAPR